MIYYKDDKKPSGIKWEPIIKYFEVQHDKIEDYEYREDECSVLLRNQYGVYNPLDPSDELSKYEQEMLAASFLNKGPDLVTKIYGRQSSMKEWGVKVRYIYEFLSHCFPLERMDIVDIENSNCYCLEDKRGLMLKDAFVYGIYKYGELVYVGKTHRFIMQRISEHIKEIKEGKQYWYPYMEGMDGVSFKILFESHNGLNERELEHIEKTFIEHFKPRFNKEGRTEPYTFTPVSTENNTWFLEPTIQEIKRKMSTIEDMLGHLELGV